MVLIENLLRRLAQLAAKCVESVDRSIDQLESGLRMDRSVTCASVGALGIVVSNNN